jgi:hypothetical protein
MLIQLRNVTLKSTKSGRQVKISFGGFIYSDIVIGIKLALLWPVFCAILISGG